MQQTGGIGQFYIPWLVAFYDTHKGKRWLNSNPPKTTGVEQTGTLFFFFLRFYVEASELFHVASGLESIPKQTAQSNCQHCLNLMKIG